jgi:hypothetical protein
MNLTVIRDMVQKLPQLISSVGRSGWQKIGAVALGILVATGAFVYVRKRSYLASEKPLSATPQLLFKVGDQVSFWGQKDSCGKVESIDMKATPPTCTISTQYGPKTFPLNKLELYKPVQPLQVGDRVQYVGFKELENINRIGTIKGLRENGTVYLVRYSDEWDYLYESKELTKIV